MLYAMQAGDDGPIKLGYSASPQVRLKRAQTFHYTQLHLRATWPGELRDEKALHRRFASARLNLEWFAYTRELHEFVAECAAAMPPPDPRPPRLAKRRSRPKQRPGMTSTPTDASHGARAAELPSHPKWGDGVWLAPEQRDADEWIGVLCDIAPSLTAHQLLTYLELVTAADEDGRVEMELATVEHRVLGRRDSVVAAQVLCGVRLLLPADESPYVGSPRAWLITEMGITRRTGVTATFVDAVAASGGAHLALGRCGIGFGSNALPVSFPVDGSFAARQAWAQQQRVVSRRRRLADAGSSR